MPHRLKLVLLKSKTEYKAWEQDLIMIMKLNSFNQD